ncbi:MULTISPECIES: HisA/HisF-related TIM barrel protein [unclassified Fusibacter]|uniref:1-(5-phosphoribosyl)-5-[(5- phosphoribosylamino)methylideneamino]imidazole-4- carboxamide isomerase n=1 Tax=unclassified Fusibacter TaxID=2624464 RepID=UPI001010C858|nr:MULTISPECIES: 1-(5-phosphoribosyl)-5-[(5-phosphoribosylamino)methylideneamino] imidazole-4-carboxamide isomerase [unclassified Fusibacter]MCK8058849.1 1-(5-phosphoribosyl)-5-[(5-phosphoribosylamino)methylideneamino] imidazole-4-carboxamide isomerase [Fusibacter sp. A2]NPE21923.1 1-(5-phosphoribosyl)-5-[(5-phosphoribosylamino)methylideneamino] imidazole-4-carboxamide isomerase [Fusibacter sp. A1]RXV61493.1 1-(5-phosphoribosyl)-5-[(5-phosphoribosylamino)methylideneamino] imidazole-4-carboxamide
MKKYAAIDLYDGKVVRLIQGDYNRVTEYGDPYEIAKKITASDFDGVHIINLNGARGETLRNLEIISKLASDLKMPVQVGGGIRLKEDAIRLLKFGVNIIVSTMFFEDYPLLESLVSEYPNRILLSLDIKNNEIMTRGWLKDTQKSISEIISPISRLELAGIIITNIQADGMQSGANSDFFSRARSILDKKMMAAGGISCKEDLELLEDLGYDGAIIGKAFYEKEDRLC